MGKEKSGRTVPGIYEEINSVWSAKNFKNDTLCTANFILKIRQ
jgi:hypothetical protein